MAYLDYINSPSDIKKMNVAELEATAEEIRAAILKRCSLFGGHVGSNLGVVEATIALHYVFNSPEDKIVFDVSHQCYAHKILTGRQQGFLAPAEYKNISGFTNPSESEHDLFMVGHTSTSLSLASGLAKARDILGQKHNVIAVIGDGSLSGGEALEGLSFGGAELNSNFIVVVNDNGMSMVENHGGLYQNLNLLKQTKGEAQLNFFKSLGYDYVYVDDGNDIKALIEAFYKVKDTTKPVVVHLNTVKGKGYAFAEQNKEAWHKHSPFDLETGKTLHNSHGKTYNDLTIDYFTKQIEAGQPLVIVTAGTPNAFGFSKEKREAFGEHYVDVGIAEEHAVSMTSALAKGGCFPIFCVQSSFLQRAYDQLSQDFGLNKSPALILVYNSGLSDNDATHLGCFDIAMASNIPNIVFLSPATTEEYLKMLDWAVMQKEYPVMMRVPTGMPVSASEGTTGLIYQNKIITQGRLIALIADGHNYLRSLEIATELKKRGFMPTVVEACWLSDVDEKMLSRLEENHQLVVTLEDGILSGGYGQKVAAFYGATSMRVLNYGAQKTFTNRQPLAEIYEGNRLNVTQIVEDVIDLMEEIDPQRMVD